MTPEAKKFLDVARQHLADAKKIATLPIYYIAAREAYLAAFHAAEAFVVERTGKPAKTHSGLQTVFARLSLSEPAIEKEFVRQLNKAFEFKSTADYGSDAPTAILQQDADKTIVMAARLIDLIAGLLSDAEKE